MRVVRAASFVLVFLALLAPPLFPEAGEAASWLQSQPRARAYGAAKAEILAVFDDAEKAGIPTAPLMDKLQEGVSKRVSADLLFGALRAELNRLSAGAQMLAREGRFITDPAAREKAIRMVSLLLAAKTQAGTIGALLEAAADAGRDSSDTLSAMAVLVQVKLSVPLSDDSLETLGTSLFKSRLSSAAFGSIPAFLLQASGRGRVDADAVVSMVADVLKGGGGLVQMQDRLPDLASGRASTKAKDTDSPGATGSAGPPGAAGAVGTPGPGRSDEKPSNKPEPKTK